MQRPPGDADTRRRAWFAGHATVMRSLRSPATIQAFLDGIPYSDESDYRCPRQVLVDRKAHCFDGALFAAAALERIGHPPLICDLRAVRDDDHVLALFEVDGHLGAIAKSNMVGLRWREPVHRTLRELVMTYFEQYYSTVGEKTLREYSAAVDLRRFDRLDWRGRPDGLDEIAVHLDDIPHRPVLTRPMIRRLRPVDRRSFDAGLMGADPKGLYYPPRPGS